LALPVKAKEKVSSYITGGILTNRDSIDTAWRNLSDREKEEMLVRATGYFPKESFINDCEILKPIEFTETKSKTYTYRREQ